MTIELDENLVPLRWKNSKFDWITFSSSTRERYAKGIPRNMLYNEGNNLITYQEFIKRMIADEV